MSSSVSARKFRFWFLSWSMGCRCLLTNLWRRKPHPSPSDEEHTPAIYPSSVGKSFGILLRWNLAIYTTWWAATNRLQQDVVCALIIVSESEKNHRHDCSGFRALTQIFSTRMQMSRNTWSKLHYTIALSRGSTHLDRFKHIRRMCSKMMSEEFFCGANNRLLKNLVVLCSGFPFCLGLGFLLFRAC